MSLTKSLERLVTPGSYPNRNRVRIRWGQAIRSSSAIADEQAQLSRSGKLTALDQLGTIRGGLVTRANAYFIVREIPFDQIPSRMKLTRSDLRRIAVVSDGLDVLSKIERQFLRPIIKGPEALQSAFGIKRSELRLFDVRADKKTLEKGHAAGALAYLRRGETVNFKTSGDDLKGGIPAQRSQVKNRRPFWYSLQGEQKVETRIVFPEHIDRRYVFTLVGEDDDSVVIDKLYLFEPMKQRDAALIHASLNTLFSWFQVELRGRSQLGEGVLELKIPDYSGIAVCDPSHLSASDRREFLKVFANLPTAGAMPSLSELGSAARHAFDLFYLELCGFSSPEAALLRLEHDLRALAGERTERRLSVADAKVSRRKMTNVAASIDAYAAKIASAVEPHPDPRFHMPEGASTTPISILAEPEGPLEIGVELFNQGEVSAGDVCVARAGNVSAAHFVRGVLLIQPNVSSVPVPTGEALQQTISEWQQESQRWQRKFKAAVDRTLSGIDDKRTRTAIEQRALRLVHAI